MFVCQTCKKCFLYKSYFMEHIQISSDCILNDVDDLSSKYTEYAETCDKCKKTFSSRRRLAHHLKKCEN